MSGSPMNTSDISWETKDEGDSKVGTTTLSLSNVQDDTSYSCQIRVDGNWVSSTVKVDVFGEFYHVL